MSIIKFNKAKFEKNKLVIDGSITIDEWKELGQSLKQVEGSVQFWIGDWARYGDKRGFTGKYTDPKVYDELEDITGLDRKTIQNYKHVAENVSSFRKEDLSHAHHAQVSQLPEEKQKEFLQRASDEGLSVRELREEVRRSELKTNIDLNERLEVEKELKDLAKHINITYTKDQRIFLINQIKH